jgi:hypothetical protein
MESKFQAVAELFWPGKETRTLPLSLDIWLRDSLVTPVFVPFARLRIPELASVVPPWLLWEQ